MAEHKKLMLTGIHVSRRILLPCAPKFVTPGLRHSSLSRSYRAQCSLQKRTIISKLEIDPKRAQKMSHLDGHDSVLEDIVHCNRYPRYKHLRVGRFRQPTTPCPIRNTARSSNAPQRRLRDPTHFDSQGILRFPFCRIRSA